MAAPMTNAFHEMEQQNGLRCSWNVWPPTRMDMARMVLPLGCMYTPLKTMAASNLVEFEPVVCRSRGCGAVLNPYCACDFQQKVWWCPFCAGKNAFPPHYAEHISDVNLPCEMQAGFTTMEYILPQQIVSPPTFVFVIDLALIDEELEDLKDSLMQSLTMMPQNALVGLITFAQNVFVHELGCASEMSKCYAFRGNNMNPIAAAQVAKQLGLAVRNDPRGAASGTGARRFLMPVGDVEYALTGILEDLQGERFAAPSKPGANSAASAGDACGNRHARCTGAALGWPVVCWKPPALSSQHGCCC